jgi:hypothetical protein
MAVRVRLRVKRGEKAREVVALVNSGYEADTPQLMIPAGVAGNWGLWPSPDAKEDFFDTAGGPVRVWIVRSAARIKAIAEDAESGPVEADIVISQLIASLLSAIFWQASSALLLRIFWRVSGGSDGSQKRGQGKARYQGNFRLFRTKFIASGISSSGIQEMGIL